MKQKITRLEDVRAGDKVTVRAWKRAHQAPGDVVTATAIVKNGIVFVLGWAVRVGGALEFVSAEREVPDLPTSPGVYMDKDGDYWELNINQDGVLWLFVGSTGWVSFTAERASEYAPFTRLVPEGSEPEKIAEWFEADGYVNTALAIRKGVWNSDANHE